MVTTMIIDTANLITVSAMRSLKSLHEQGERSRKNSEKHEVAFAKEPCYTYNKIGHRYWKCPESQVSGDSGTERSVSPKPREGKVRFEKESNKESRPISPKKNPNLMHFSHRKLQ